MDLIWFLTGYKLTAADYNEILRTKFIFWSGRTSPVVMWCSSRMERPPIR
ncbi:Hypothetical protein FKW44_010200 [Caligus rogercresseyi]|uniref:Uncharacterized protein n=1 Tax=Caligus rogercresseyi TaxID=217165 RepID=A0A7T8HHA2_CALRO|nr:Hypothetical protein FKW44_010200 [Caligus rogercresseyi]